MVLLLPWLCPAALRADGVRPEPGTLPGAPDAVARYLEDRAQVAVVELDGTYDREFEGEVNAYPRALVAREFFAHHPDRYDFLVVFTSFEFDTGEATAFHLGVRNEVQGIGLPIYDSSADFGSDGRLQGYVDMAGLGRHAADPLDSEFEDTLSTLAHEILHQWAAHVRFRTPEGELSDALLGRDGSHWSYLLDSDASVLYGNDWRDDGAGSFTSVGALDFFSPLDLYLAGFFAPEEVPPMLLIEAPGVDREQLPRRGDRVDGQATVVTIDDVIAAEGPRVPSADDSPKQFRAAFVLVVRPGETATSGQIAALERIRQGLITRFSVLTGGRGILEVYPEALPVGAPGAPEPVDPGDLRGVEASLLDGLAWLRGRQSPEGYWQDRPTTRGRDTALALAALATLDAQFTGETDAFSWLLARDETTTDYLARTAGVLVFRGRDASARRTALLALQNPDGGWGLGPDYASDPLDTALALLALAGPGATDASTLAAIGQGADFLIAAEGGDGGWGTVPGGASRTGVTAVVLRALHAAGRFADVGASAVAFLVARQNPDGGFGDSPSTVHDTAAALLALMTVGGVPQVDAPGARAYLGSRQAVDGSWEGSVYSTALAVDALKRFGFPNWRFTAPVAVAPAAPRDGERVRLELRVANDGNVEAPAGVLRLYEGDPEAGGAAVAEAALPALAPRQEVAVTVLWDSFDRAGANALVAELDPDAEVEELSELDNRIEVEVAVAPAPDGADLEVTEADLSVSPAVPAELPASLAVSATVRNLGRTDVAAVRLRLLAAPQGVDPAEAVVVAEAEVAVPQRSSTPVHFNYLLETPGATTLIVQVDPGGEIAEADEANNEARAVISTAAAVDLAVTPDDLAVEGVVSLGRDVTLRATLRNRGTVASPDAEVRFVVTDGETTRDLPVAAVNLPAGGTVERSVVWRVDLEGELVFSVAIDPADQVAESDETNNQASLPLAGAGSGDAPDLTIAYEDLAFDPDPGREGAPVTVSALVRNVGGVEAATVEVAFYEGDPAQGAPRIGDFQVLPALAPGGSATASVVLPALAGTGDRLIYAVADPNGAVAELEEGDNAAFRILDVVALPDLAVSPAAIVVAPSLPEPGQTVSTTVTVANLGEQEAAGVVVRLTVDGAPAGPDVTLPSIGPDTTAEAAFAWTFPTAASTVRLSAVVDPGAAVPEGDESNNQAERDVAAFDPTQAVSNPYFSPNGDGVKDSSAYSFTLAAPAVVTVEVVDSRGAVVRRQELGSAVKGRFEWDGRGDGGAVVRDGDYRFRAVSAAGAVLDETPVTVDTDHWPLLATLGTPFERFSNLTCALSSAESFQVTAEADEAFFRIESSYFYSSQHNGYIGSGGIYRVPASGYPYERIVGISYPEHFSVSDDGEKMAHDWTAGNNAMAVSNTDGSDRQLTDWVPGIFDRNVGFRPGTQEVVYLQYYPYASSSPETNYRIHARPLDGSGPDRVVVDLPRQSASTVYGSFYRPWFSPDGRHLFLNACFRTNTSYSPCPYTERYRLLDLETGEHVGLEDFSGAVSWSPDGTRLAAVRIVDYDDLGDLLELVIWGLDGRIERRIPVPRAPIGEIPAYAEFGPFPGRSAIYGVYEDGYTSPTWSESGDELAFAVLWWEPGDGYYAEYTRVSKVGVATGAIEDVGFSEPLVERYSFHVSTWDGSGWVERGERHFSRYFSEREIDLTEFLPDSDGEYKVRIRQTGLEAAHVDRVALRTGPRGEQGSDFLPASATGVPAGEDVLDPVLAVDHDVLDVHEREIEVRWDPPVDGETRLGDLRLALVAREESLEGRDARPFDYPAEGATGEASYHHVVGSGAAMRVDGLQTGADGLTEPLFATWSRPDTGHPAATVYGYAGSDGEALYAALDFTVDNTEDGENDWASLWVETAAGWREFRVAASDSTWGAVGFTRTGRVGHRHKYYEFRVPLAEIGAASGETVAIRFQAYGTAAVLPGSDRFLPHPGGALRWSPGEDKLFYSTDYSGFSNVIHLDDGNRFERVLDQFTTLGGASFVAGGRKMVFRDGRDILDPEHECYNPSSEAESSIFLFDSLANDAVELEGEPTPDGRGIELSGTATDLHFSRWLLEYADENVAGFWTPIGSPETVPVVDELLATWVPPGSGSYRVRLTVEDLAGNRRSVSRFFSSASASPSSITDLSVAPRYVSPNGDGVQDQAAIRYRVLSPVHLEIAVSNAQGDRVRTLRRDHSEIGSVQEVAWDGRGDSGLPVPDGRYRVTIAGYEFPVTVDTVAPAIGGPELLGPETVVEAVTGTGKVSLLDLGPAVRWCAADANPDPAGATLFVGEGADPASWRRFATSEVRTSCFNQDPPWPSEALSLSRFVGHRYRLEASDLAGNRATASTPLAGEELLIHRFWQGSLGDAEPLPEIRVPVGGAVLADVGEPVRMRVAETARDPLARLFVRFRAVCPAGDPRPCSDLWQEVELSQVFDVGGGPPSATIPEEELEVEWDASFLDPTFAFDVQLRARKTAGGDVDSNLLRLRFRNEGIVYDGLVGSHVRPEPDPDAPAGPASDLQLALGRAGLDPAVGYVLSATETVEEPLAEVFLLLTSEDDPRYVAGEALPLAGAAGGVMVFDGSDLLPCHTYRGVVVARTVPADGSASRPVESNLRSTEIPCLGIDARFEEIDFPACGVTPDPRRRLVLTPRSFDGVELTLLTAAFGDLDDVTFSVNRPEPDRPYVLEIDTGDFPEGVHPLFVRITNGEGAEIVRKGKLVVDRQPPAVQVTYPVSGQRLCADTLEPGAPGVTVEGLLDDLAAGEPDSVLQVRQADGSWLPDLPEAWEPKFLSSRQDRIPRTLEPWLRDLEERLSGFSGSATVRWAATDSGGHRVCAAPVTFSLDSHVEGMRVLADRNLIAPDGDGFADQVQFSVSSAESTVLDVLVYRGEERTLLFDTVVAPIGEPVRTVATGLGTAGGVSIVWDGRGDGGGVVEDGLYAVVFRATDGCANQLELARGVTVDLTPPQVEILAPATGEDLPLVVEVVGTAADPHFLDYVVEHGVGVEPFTWAVLGRGQRAVTADRLALWNTYGLQGPQTLRLTARDMVGNEAAHLVTVDLPLEESLITDLQATPDPFSPNGDGRRESTSVRFGFAQEVTASLAITTGGGAPVRSLATGEVFPAASALRTWDGRNDAGERVPDGLYRVRLEAAATFDPSLTQVESLSVVVDSTPPAIEVTRPRDGFTPGDAAVVGSVEDPLLVEYVVEVTSTPELPDWQEIARGDEEVAADELARLGGLAEGEYALRITARDAAENRSERIVPFEVDDAPPEVEILAPAEGAVVGAAGGAVTVRGTVVEAHPHAWTLEVGAGAEPSSWTTLADGEGLPASETLLAWLPQGIADGDYTLRLTAEDAGGLTGEDRVALTVDNTPPVVAIATPAPDAGVSAPLDVLGTAADPHLLLYQVEIAPAGTESWSELGRSASAVGGGILVVWRALPPDGAYRLRLRARDRAGNAAATEVPVRVDTSPPAPPQGLTAVLENDVDGRLSWQANGEADLAGYHVYRGGARLTTVPVAQPEYLDPGLPDARHVYTVTAVDDAGLESAPSAPAELHLDRVGPTATIHEPSSGATVHGLVEVKVTATSSDFAEYRLYVGEGDGAGTRTLLRSSPTPVRSEMATAWSTSGLAEGSTHTLRLEADDLSGNTSVAEAAVVVDNLAPAVPTGLAVSLATDDATLTWDANGEVDLAGYLLYRDGRLVHGSGDDLVRRAIAGTTFEDEDLPDGAFTWRLAAIDQAGNVSGLSAPATASLDLRAPHAEIVDPQASTRFEHPLYVLATTPDRDLAEVRFEWRPAGETAWTLLTADTAEPWESTWDPSGLAFGDYELRAVARDQGGRTDPAPGVVPVTYVDLDRPARVLDLALRVDGGDVALTWSANSEEDLAGYHLDRVADGASPVRVTGEPVTGTAFTDAGLPDDTYRYTLVAVDVHGNESDPTAPREAVVYTPELVRPLSPRRTRTADLRGTVLPGAEVTVEVVRPGATETLPPPALDAGGAFLVAGIGLETGRNEIAVTATDAAGNRSKRAVAAVVAADPPAPPTGLAATVVDRDVSFTWDAEPDLLGYRVFVDGWADLSDLAANPTSAVASSQFDSGASAARAVDSSSYTWWSPALGSPVDGEWLEATWPTPLLLTEIGVDWYGSGYRALDYDVDVWDGEQWVRAFELRDGTGDTDTLVFDDAYRTTALRLTLRRIAGSETEAEAVRLADLDLVHRPLTSAPPVDLYLYHGHHDLAVSAVATTGFESDPAVLAEVPVGDAEGPEPVVLSATVDGSDVTLTWTASASPDLSYYVVFRDGVELDYTFDLTGRTYLDVAVPNGLHAYTVVGRDSRGNSGPPSNQAEVTVEVPAPPAPVALAVSDPGLGDALDLAWTPGAGEPATAAFRVFRSLSSGGPYDAVGETAETSYRDRGLTAGTTYHYVVVGLDGFGNAGPASNQASGTPVDREGPRAVLHHPAAPGAVYRTRESVQPLVGGTTEPGVSVRVRRGGEPVAETTATSELEKDVLAYSDGFGLVRPSPDGSRLWLDGYYSHQLVDFATGEVGFVAGVSYSTVHWLPDGEHVLAGVYDTFDGSTLLSRIRISDLEREVFGRYDYVDVALPRPDGEVAAVVGETFVDEGLYRVDLGTGETSLLLDVPTYHLIYDTLSWSPDGRLLAYVRTQPSRHVEILDPETGSITEVPGYPEGFGALSWSPDGSALVYVAEGDDFWWQIWRYDLATGATAPVTSGERDHFTPLWSPDGRSIAYASYSNDDGLERLELLDLETGETTELHVFDSWEETLGWSRTGRLFTLDGGVPVRISPAGRFEVRSVPLRVGENVFTAVATDAAGNVGAPSPPMTIELIGGGADLAVTEADLAVLPSVPLAGQAVTVSATVKNVGSSESPAADLSLVLAPPSGTPLPVGSGLGVPALAPGTETVVTVPVTLTAAAGRWSLVARVDPLDRVSEADETNNRAELPFPVLADAAPALFVTTDRESYGPGETVAIEVELANAGPDFFGTLEVRIEDPEGFLVEELAPVAVTPLESGRVELHELSWGTGDVFAGDYRVRAELVDGGGTPAAAGSSDFAVTSASGLAARVATDRALYEAGVPVRITASVEHVGGNGTVADAEARIEVRDAGGAAVASWTEALAELPPASEVSVTVEWGTATAAPGPYRVVLDVTRGGLSAAAAETGFEVVPADLGLAGTLSLSTHLPEVGTPLGVSYGVTNGTATNHLALPVRVLLADPASGDVVERFDTAVDLASGATAQGATELPTGALALREYRVLLQVDLPGAGGTPEPVTLATAAIQPADGTPPTVTVEAPEDGAFVATASPTLRAIAVDALSPVASVAMRIDGGPRLPAVEESAVEARWAVAASGLAEGVRTLEVRAVDAAGNEGRGTSSFTVDLTPPAVTVTGVVDGERYADPVVPVVEVVEEHPALEEVTLDGAPFVSGTEVAERGDHELRVVAEDLAGHRTEVQVSFTVGVGEPELVAEKTAALAADADGDGVPSPGDEIAYTVVVTNQGGGEATEVVLTDAIPAHAALVPGSVATDLGSVVGEEPVEVALGVVEGGAVATVTFRVRVDLPVPAGVDRIVNQGVVTSAELPAVPTDDPAAGGDADPTVTMITAAPELVAEKVDLLAVDADEDGVPSPGDTLEYRVTVRNVGNTSATGVGVLDPVPLHASLVAGSATSSQGTVEEGDPVRFLLGEVPGAANAEVRFRVVVDDPIAAGVRMLSNQGLVESAELADVVTDDPAVDGPADATVTAVTAAPDLLVEKTALLFGDEDGDNVASPGDLLLYRITLVNRGNTAATAAVLTDPLPEHTVLEPGTVQAVGGEVLAEDPITVDLGELAVGEEPVVSFQVRIVEPFPLDVLAVANQAAVTSAELPEVASDDPATSEAGDATATEVFITPEIAVADAAAEEIDGALTFVVSLSEPGSRPVSVSYATVEGSAAAGLDFAPATGRLTFVPGETEAAVTVTVADDALDERDELLSLRLAEADGGALADAEATGTIRDDDPPPFAAVDDATVEEAAGEATVTLRLSSPSGLAVALDWTTADGTAVAGADYTASSGTVVIPAGLVAATVTVPVADDAVDELDETFLVRLTGAVDAIPADAEGVVAIRDDDEARISVDDASAQEGDPEDAVPADLLFRVRLATEADREIAVDFETAPGTATAGVDYQPAAGTLTFAPGETARTVAVAVVPDRLLEPDEETVALVLSEPVGTTLGDGDAVGTILDDERCAGPNLLVNPGAEARPVAGELPGWLEVVGEAWRQRTDDPAPAEGEAYFFAGETDLGELAQDVDVAAYDVRIDAAPGQLFAFSGRVRTGDEVPPDTARIVVEYRDATGTTVLDAFDSGEIASPGEWLEVADARAAPVGTGWIRIRLIATRFVPEALDAYFDGLELRSLRAPVLTVGDAVVYEGGTGNSAGGGEAVFPVTLSCPFHREVSFAFATADGTATAGEDYSPVAGALTLPAGEVATEVRVPVLPDGDHEGHETFTLELSAAEPADQVVALDPVAEGLILNDDFCARSPGFWKNHREVWPAERLVVGAVEYDDAGLAALLDPKGSDAAGHLARQLVATRMNLLVGSDPYILPVVEDADAFLVLFPPGSDPKKDDKQLANAIKDQLDAYNNPSCQEVPVLP